MSDKVKKTKKVNWTKLQLIGFYAIIIIGATFWAGVTVGTQATLNSQAQESAIRESAVESYKAELSKENQ